MKSTQLVTTHSTIFKLPEWIQYRRMGTLSGDRKVGHAVGFQETGSSGNPDIWFGRRTFLVESEGEVKVVTLVSMSDFSITIMNPTPFFSKALELTREKKLNSTPLSPFVHRARST